MQQVTTRGEEQNRQGGWAGPAALALAAVIVAFPIAAGNVCAQSPPPTAEEVKKALDARREDLKSTLDRAGNIERDVAKLAEERGKINQRLQDTAAGSRRAKCG